MYHKIIGDREVFSTCKVIRTEDGTVISNPSPEQIAAEGWEEYIPPVVPPTPQTEPGMDDIIQAVKKMLSSAAEQLSDEDALAVAALFPTWASKLPNEQTGKAAEAVEAGEKLWDDGELWKVLQPHTVQADWRPKDSPSLFTRVSIEEWPEWVPPQGSEDAYHKDDPCSHNGKHWRSDYDNNVWEPGVFGWREA